MSLLFERNFIITSLPERHDRVDFPPRACVSSNDIFAIRDSFANADDYESAAFRLMLPVKMSNALLI